MFLAYFIDFIRRGRILIQVSEMSFRSAVGSLVIHLLQSSCALTADF